MNNIEQKLKSNSANEVIDAIFEAFELGVEGIDLIIPTLQAENSKVREAALLVLSESDLYIAKQAIDNYWLSKIEHLHMINRVTVNTKILPSYFAIADFNNKLICYWELDYKLSFVELWDLKTGKSDNHSNLGTHWLRLGNQGRICIVNFQDSFRFLNLYDADINRYHSPKNEYLTGINMCGSFVLSHKKSLAASSLYNSNCSSDIKIRDYENNKYNCIYNTGRGFRLCERDHFVYFCKKEIQENARWLYDASALLFTPDDLFLVGNFIRSVHTRKNAIKIWHAETGELIKTVDDLPFLAITSLAISSDKKIIACGIREEKICVWEVLTDSIIYTFDEIFPCTLSNNGRVLIHATSDYKIIVRDLIGNKILNTLQGHTAQIIHLAMSCDREFIASYDKANKIKIWGITGSLD